MNYNFMYEIEQKILNKTKEPDKDFYLELKRNMYLLKMLTKDMKVKPGNISSINNAIDKYNFMVKAEQGNITVIQHSYDNDMWVSINGENKSVGYRTDASLFRGLTGHYETNEGMFILSAPPTLGESKYGQPGKPFCTLEIHFYDTEAMSYIEEHRNKMSLSENDIEHYLNKIGIFPDGEMTLGSSIEEVIELANEFYLEPNRLINMMRMKNAKENTEGKQIKH